MAIESIVAGAYTGVWNSVAIGMTQQGFTLQRENFQELINQSDLYGETIIDTVYRGGNTFLQWSCNVWRNGGTPPLVWMFGATFGTIWTVAAPIARLGSAISKILVLTAVAGTPAAASPATLTASKALLAPGFNLELLFDSRIRRVPMRMLLLPTDDGAGAGVLGTGTVFVLT